MQSNVANVFRLLFLSSTGILDETKSKQIFDFVWILDKSKIENDDNPSDQNKREEECNNGEKFRVK